MVQRPGDIQMPAIGPSVATLIHATAARSPQWRLPRRRSERFVDRRGTTGHLMFDDLLLVAPELVVAEDLVQHLRGI
jgi:hypothetical protein